MEESFVYKNVKRSYLAELCAGRSSAPDGADTNFFNYKKYGKEMAEAFLLLLFSVPSLNIPFVPCAAMQTHLHLDSRRNVCFRLTGKEKLLFPFRQSTIN